MNVTRRLVDFSHDLTYDALPKDVQDRAKYFFLDELCLILRGQHVKSTQIILGFAKKVGGRGDAPATGTHEWLPAQYAALVNGASAHSLELDDVGDEASAHPGTVLFPALLPISHECQSNGKQFLASIVAGYEVVIKIGKVLTPAGMYRKGYHPTTLCGNFGAAIAVAKLIGLDADKMQHAIGMAGSTTGGNMQCLTEVTPATRFQAGWAAHNGVLCARLAEAGFEGPLQILEGRDGIFHAYSDDPQYNRIAGPFADPYEIMRTSVKAHACCGYSLMAMDAVLEIVKKHDLRPAAIKKITVGLLKTGIPIVAEPVEQKIHPKTQVDTQFSVQYGVAICVLKRKALLDEHDVKYCGDPEMIGLMAKVECVNDPRLDALYPKQWSSWARIETESGQTFSAEVPYRKGSPENPLSLDEMIEKFTSLAAPVLKPDASGRIISEILSLEKMQDMRELHRLLENSLI